MTAPHAHACVHQDHVRGVLTRTCVCSCGVGTVETNSIGWIWESAPARTRLQRPSPLMDRTENLYVRSVGIVGNDNVRVVAEVLDAVPSSAGGKGAEVSFVCPATDAPRCGATIKVRIMW